MILHHHHDQHTLGKVGTKHSETTSGQSPNTQRYEMLSHLNMKHCLETEEDQLKISVSSILQFGLLLEDDMGNVTYSRAAAMN